MTTILAFLKAWYGNTKARTIKKYIPKNIKPTKKYTDINKMNLFITIDHLFLKKATDKIANPQITNIFHINAIFAIVITKKSKKKTGNNLEYIVIKKIPVKIKFIAAKRENLSLINFILILRACERFLIDSVSSFR